MRSDVSHKDQIAEIRQILVNYDLGRLVDLELNRRGFVNTGFSIETEKNGVKSRYFLRRYKPEIHEEELIFEHNLISHLSQQTILPVAHLHRTLTGSTYFCRQPQAAGTPTYFYAIFDHLPGEDRFTWVDPHCNLFEITSAARTLAQFHSAVTFMQLKGKRYEPGVRELLACLAATVEKSTLHSKNTIFDDYLTNSKDTTLRSIQDILSILQAPDAGQMPQIVIHCDFHPGNLKFQGYTVSGLFDFDWSKIDYRSFDLGLAIWYFFTNWEGEQDGQIDIEQARCFLKAYQETIEELPGIGTLTHTERKNLPAMINAGNLYVLNWTILDYYNKDVDETEYLKYLQHSINSIHCYQEARYHQITEE
jgi:homoserine kinase type II